MAVADAFTRFIADLSGRAVVLVPSAGGADGALAGLALHQLCASHGVSCLREGRGTGDEPILIGSAEAASAVLRGVTRSRRVAFVPGSLAGYGGIAAALRFNATLFFRDAVSLRRAELMGADPGRLHLCHDLAAHLDVEALRFRSEAGAGTLALGARAEPGDDGVDLRWDGRDGRWSSPERCRDAVSLLANLIEPYGRLRTDSPALAILASKLGRPAVLGHGSEASGNGSVHARTIVPLCPDVALAADDPAGVQAAERSHGEVDGSTGPIPALEAEVDRLHADRAAARREAEFAVQAREAAEVALVALRDELDDRVVTAVRDMERRSAEVERIAGERLIEARRTAEEAQRAAVAEAQRAAAAEAQEAAAAATGARQAAELAADALRRDYESRVTSLERARREASERDAASSARTAELEGAAAELKNAVQLRTRQALELQAALDEGEERRRAVEARLEAMRRLLDARTAALDAAVREAASARRELGAVLSSASWRASRPLRGVARSLRRLRGPARDAHRA